MRGDDAGRERCGPGLDRGLQLGGRPAGVDPEALSNVGDFFDRNPANHTLVSTLAGLGEPARGGAEWHTLLDALHRGQQLARDQIAAARARDVSAVTADVQATQVNNSTNEGFSAAGFDFAADFCAVLYGG